MSESKCRVPEASSFLPANTGCTDSQIDIAVEDWDAMFGAVLERLRSSVDDVLITSPVPLSPDAASLTQSIVLECAEALDQLHVALKHDRSRKN